MSVTTIGAQTPGGPLQGTDQFIIERIGGANFKVDFNDILVMANKGDIMTRNILNAVPLAVGSNGQVLTADSAEATGLKWGDAGVTSIIASELKADSLDDTFTMAFTNIPFDGTVEYIELVMSFSVIGLGSITNVTFNGITTLNYEEEQISQSEQEGWAQLSPVNQAALRGYDTPEPARLQTLRFKIYIGAGLGGAGPQGWWEEMNIEDFGQSPNIKKGMGIYTGTDIVSGGLSSIEISLVGGGKFSQNSTSVVYKTASNFGAVTPLP